MKMSNLTMTMKAVMMMLTLTLICLQMVAEGSADTCVEGDNLDNAGGSCDFGAVQLTLCDWQNMEETQLAWKNFFNDVNKSPSVLTDTKDLTMSQIVRLKSPLLCATNSTFLHYYLNFAYSMFDSDRCRLSLSVSSAAGDKLAEIWNTQEKTYNPRSNGWSTEKVNVSNSDSSFYLIFSAERISASETTTVALDSLSYTSTPIPTTTPSPPTTTPPPTSSTASPTTTTPATTTPTTTAATTVDITNRTTVAATTATDKLVSGDDTLIWGLSTDVVIGIGVSVVVFIVLIIVVAIVCRRVRREEDVKTVSFAMNSPTAYNVNEDKKLTGKRRKDMKARASVLVPSKHSDWQPDRSLY